VELEQDNCRATSYHVDRQRTLTTANKSTLAARVVYRLGQKTRPRFFALPVYYISQVYSHGQCSLEISVHINVTYYYCNVIATCK